MLSSLQVVVQVQFISAYDSVGSVADGTKVAVSAVVISIVDEIVVESVIVVLVDEAVELVV